MLFPHKSLPHWPDLKASRSLIALLMSAAAALATTAQAAEPQDQAVSEEEPWMDRARDTVTESLDTTANWFDRFFGDPRSDIDDPARASLRVILDGFASGVEGESDFDVRFRGSADLPRFEKKVKLVFSSDADAGITGEDLVDPGGMETRARKETDGGVGLRYQVNDTTRHSFSIGGGLKGGLPPDVALNGRYRYTLPFSADTVTRFTETLYWKSDDGFGVSSLADIEHYPNQDELWRYSLFGDYGEETDGLEWTTQATWLRRLSDRTAISVRAGINGETEPDQILEEGWLTFRFRRNFMRSWLFYEIEPGLSWHIKEDYDTEPTLALRLEVQFYKD